MISHGTGACAAIGPDTIAPGCSRASGRGGVLLRTGADDLAWFARRLVSLPFGFEIHAPAALRTELARCATRLRELARPRRR
jgi:hypothetical protein